jgi:chromosome partitioning protein
MKILALVSAKGGAGKSTISVNLAALCAREGFTVGLIDLDPQATASTWHAMRGLSDIGLVVAHPPTLDRALDQLRGVGTQIAIVDTPPQHSTAAATAVRLATMVVVPARPSAFDLAAIRETALLVRQSGRRAVSVLNAVPPSSSVSVQAELVLDELALPVVGRLGQRIGWQHAAARGRGVSETEPHGSSATELGAVWSRLHEIMNS